MLITKSALSCVIFGILILVIFDRVEDVGARSVPSGQHELKKLNIADPLPEKTIYEPISLEDKNLDCGKDLDTLMDMMMMGTLDETTFRRLCTEEVKS